MASRRHLAHPRPEGLGTPRSPGGRARMTHRLLAIEYPQAECELDHRSPFELLAATILSAQTTDVAVNKVTPALFARYPDAESMARATPAEIEPIIGSIGLFRSKAKNLVGMAQRLTSEFDGEVPGAMTELTSLPGVGRKTANVVRSVALGLPGLPVDTHVARLVGRLGITEETDPVRIEHEVGAMVPASERGAFSLRVILHGRRVCGARNPRCEECVLAWFCPSAA